MEVSKVWFWLSMTALVVTLAGETPGCSLEAKVATAQVYANRLQIGIEGGWFAKGEPAPDDVTAAMLADSWPDLVDGALYMIGPGDRARMPWLEQRTGRWECPGTFVESWR